MRLKVDLLPRDTYGDVVVIIDVLRATTLAPLLFEQGLETLFLTASLRTARSFAQNHDLLLLGERGGVPLEGFHFGASPAELRHVDFSGKHVVMTTQNGPNVLSFAASARVVLLGGFYNARAVSQRVFDELVSLGNPDTEIAFVCAGQSGSESLDDTLAAGFLARRIQNLAARQEIVLELRDAARLAMALLRAFPDPQEALVQSQAGEILIRLGLHDDLAMASLISQTDKVPTLCATIPWDPEPVYAFKPTKQALSLGGW